MNNLQVAVVVSIFGIALIGSILTIRRLQEEKFSMLRKNMRLEDLVREALPLAVGETFVTTGSKRKGWYDHISRARKELGLREAKTLIDG
jgi:hypothetical protein